MKQKWNITKEDAIKVREKMKEVKCPKIYNKLEIIALSGEGKTDKEIVEIKHCKDTRARYLRRDFLLKGIDYFAVDHRNGRNHALMTKEEEKEFLQQFEEEAEKGQLITVKEIAEKLDQKTGKTRSSRSTIYRILHRNGYRKIMPRPAHPKKASEEEINSSKKLKQL